MWRVYTGRLQGQGNREQARVQLSVWGVACWVLDLSPVLQLITVHSFYTHVFLSTILRPGKEITRFRGGTCSQN